MSKTLPLGILALDISNAQLSNAQLPSIKEEDENRIGEKLGRKSLTEKIDEDSIQFPVSLDKNALKEFKFNNFYAFAYWSKDSLPKVGVTYCDTPEPDKPFKNFLNGEEVEAVCLLCPLKGLYNSTGCASKWGLIHSFDPTTGTRTCNLFFLSLEPLKQLQKRLVRE